MEFPCNSNAKGCRNSVCIDLFVGIIVGIFVSHRRGNAPEFV